MTEASNDPAGMVAAVAADSGPDDGTRRMERTVGVLEASMGAPFFPGNQIDVLRNGVQIFPAMLEAIDAASERIDFLTFVYWKGDISRRVANALANAARRGVQVRALLDGVGAFPMDRDHVELMTQSGVDVRWFRPVRQWLAPWKMTHRTHRKVLICDGEVAFTGGVGIAGEWEGDAQDEREWRDTQFRIRGPAVHGLQAAFLGNWLEVAPRDTLGRATTPAPETSGPARVQVVRSTASVEWSDLSTLVRTLIDLPEQRLRISTPYFVPDPTLVDAICDTASRGVAVDVLVPGPHTDQRVVKVAGEGCYERLLETGVRIWEYQPTLIHQKIIAVDDHLVTIGSGNLNHRSLMQDDEVQLVVLDTDFADRVGRMLDDDFAQALPVEPGDWARRGLLRRVAEKVAGLFRRQL